MRGGAAALLASVWLAAIPAWAAETGPATVTITGELIDLKCYVTMGLRGAIHQECAQKCARDHWPVAVLDEQDQRLYPLVLPSASVAEAAGGHVRVTGAIVQGTDLLSPSRLEVERDGTWSDLALPTASEAQ